MCLSIAALSPYPEVQPDYMGQQGWDNMESGQTSDQSGFRNDHVV
ncbi:hypothetical protein [Salinisphaera sp. G21_0]|nr:hypothetical protein [Salinisphaera sp. G21_0]